MFKRLSKLSPHLMIAKHKKLPSLYRQSYGQYPIVSTTFAVSIQFTSKRKNCICNQFHIQRIMLMIFKQPGTGVINLNHVLTNRLLFFIFLFLTISFRCFFLYPLPIINRRTSIILGLFRLDSLANYAPEYVRMTRDKLRISFSTSESKQFQNVS